MATLLERLRKARPDLTGREQKIAFALEAGYPHAGLQSATALGERVGVSAATVVRFAAKLGYSGYPDLQRELREEVEARFATPLQRLDQSARPEIVAQSGEDLIGRTLEVALTALTRSFGAIDRRTIEAMAETLSACTGRIFILGEKKGRSIALYLYAQLTLCMPRVTMITTDSGFEADQLLDIGAEDCLIAVDVRRYVQRGLAMADWASRRGATLLVLSDSIASPLYARTPLHLAAATNGAGAFDSYIGLMLMVDILTNLVVAHDPKRARARLERGEEAWEHLRVFTRESATAAARDEE